jgi:hypothetical protein
VGGGLRAVPDFRRRDPQGVCSTSAIESVNARIRRAVEARGNFPNEQAALKCVYMAIMSLDPTGTEVQAERAVARAELEGAPSPDVLGAAEVYAMVDSFGDVSTALAGAIPERLAGLYAGLGLQVGYEPGEQIADVGARLERRVNSERVRRGSCTLTTRLWVA